jgi:hypothetical protein
MVPGDLSGKVSASVSRVAPFTPVSSLFVVEPLEKPGRKDLAARLGVAGGVSNPDLVEV